MNGARTNIFKCPKSKCKMKYTFRILWSYSTKTVTATLGLQNALEFNRIKVSETGEWNHFNSFDVVSFKVNTIFDGEKQFWLLWRRLSLCGAMMIKTARTSNTLKYAWVSYINCEPTCHSLILWEREKNKYYFDLKCSFHYYAESWHLLESDSWFFSMFCD